MFHDYYTKKYLPLKFIGHHKLKCCTIAARRTSSIPKACLSVGRGYQVATFLSPPWNLQIPTSLVLRTLPRQTVRESTFYGRSPAKCTATSTVRQSRGKTGRVTVNKSRLCQKSDEDQKDTRVLFTRDLCVEGDGDKRAVRKRGRILGTDFTRWRRSYRSRWDFIFDRVLIHPVGPARPLSADKSIRPTEITDSLR